MYGTELFYYAMTILFLICFSTYASHRATLNEYQRMELIVSTGLYIIVFGLIGARLLNDPLLQEHISAGSLLYVNWYYWTYSSVNGILS